MHAHAYLMKITELWKNAVISSTHFPEWTDVKQDSHGSRFRSLDLYTRFHLYEAGLTKLGHEVSENRIFK
jgi:hypothetical protein